MPTIYRNKLDDLCVSLLLKIWRGVIEGGQNRINLKELELTYSERSKITQLRFHALVAKVKNEKGNHIPATWLITKRGSDFLHGRVAVPKYAWTQKNKVIAREDVKTRVEKATDKELNWLVARNDFKVLSEFSSTYEICGDRLIKIPVVQMSMAL
jgi:hypothetical protein